MRYYSQNGEDFLISEIFKDLPHGFFVEIGCIDGRRFSNTLSLEERGWRGVCIEAHRDYIELLKKNRPNSLVIHCAVGEKDEDNVTFYANVRGSFSTLDRSQEKRWRENYQAYFTGFEEQIVAKRTISSLLDEHGISSVDFMSLDIEGYEIEALQGLDLARHRPRLLVIESDSKEHENAMDKILLPAGYTKGFNISGNWFYSTGPMLLQRVIGRRYQALLTHTQHP